MDALQSELDATYPLLEVQLVGVNERGQEFSNAAVTEGRDIPWLQDVDADENGISDVWYDLWDVSYRDVVVLDGEGELFGVYNLTSNDLREAEKYSELKELLIDAAMQTHKPWQNKVNPLDVDNNGNVAPLDVLIIANEINLNGVRVLPPPFGDEAPTIFYDINGDNFVAASDAIQAINFINGFTDDGQSNSEGESNRDEPRADDGEHDGLNGGDIANGEVARPGLLNTDSTWRVNVDGLRDRQHSRASDRVKAVDAVFMDSMNDDLQDSRRRGESLSKDSTTFRISSQFSPSLEEVLAAIVADEINPLDEIA